MVHPVNNFKLIKKEVNHLYEKIKIINRKMKIEIKIKINKNFKNHNLQDVSIILMLNFQSNSKIKFEIIIMNFWLLYKHQADHLVTV